jgi:hypothetical protein
MSEETAVPTEETDETNEFPWKKVFMALAIGATAAGATYALSKKVTVNPDESSDETETPEA